MGYFARLAFIICAAALCAGCGGSQPPIASQEGADSSVPLADNSSILEKLKKDVVIGSTVDPGNGDTGPHAISIVQITMATRRVT